MNKEKIFGKQSIFAKIGKRNLLIIAAVLLVGVAVYLNYVWFYTPAGNLGYGDNNMSDQYGDSAGTGSSTDTGSYFASAQLSREKARDEALEVLQAVVDNEDATEELKNEALASISQIADEIQKESDIESLITAKGFEQCVAVLNGDTACIVVKAENLQAAQIAQINAIVYEQTGITPAGITIIGK